MVRASPPHTAPPRKRRPRRATAWLRRHWRALMSPSGVAQRALFWMTHSLGKLIRWLWSAICRAARWAWCDLVPPVSCLLAIYVGVCLSMLLPASMWSWLALPALAQFTGASVTAFPLADLPEQAALVRGLLAAIPLAVRVFATGGYEGWKASQDALGARLLYACHAGIVWPKAWWRGARRAPEASSAP